MFGRKKVGIALSGGGVRALSHLGVLQVLDRTGVEINAVSGCSMGAIVGAVYSLGISLDEVEQYIKKTDWRAFLMFSMFSLSRNGIINEKKIDEVLKKFLGSKTFDDCQRQFCAVAVDIIKGQKVVIRDGKLADAVRASIAIPGIIPPVCRDGMLLVDGGVMEPLPTEALKALGTNFIIASSIVFESENPIKEKYAECDQPEKSQKDLKKMSIQTILDKSMSLMHTQVSKSYLEKADLVIEPKIGDYGFLDFTRSAAIIDSGRKAAIAKIPEIRRRLRV